MFFRSKQQIPRRIVKIHMPRNTAGPDHDCKLKLKAFLNDSVVCFRLLYVNTVF